MTTALVYDATCLTHDTGRGHPERPDRIREMMQVLGDEGLLTRCVLTKPWLVGDELMRAITAVHDGDYVKRLEATCQRGDPYIDVPDSAICPESYNAALVSAAASLAAVDEIVQGRAHNAMCLMRPPGHHCEYDRSMGFCLLNNISIAAQWLIDAGHARRIAIVDFDVHHGNGTQHLFEDRDDVLYCSVHQHPMTLFPGTGYEREHGAVGTPGINRTVNVPVMPGAGDDQFLHALDQKILPIVRDFGPDFILVSAGFDAHSDDPLAQCEVTTDGFETITRRITDAADAVCDGKIACMLEGGYHLEAVAHSVARHVKVLIEAGEQHQ
ncbi:MAG: histone deacetylase [Phycisphaerales bacterium]|nr:histone deacetylase [Phycisphaerales bacterium]